MALDASERIIIETRVASKAPSPTTSYILWLFIGIFSGHRFYLRRPGTAILQILSYSILIGFFWWIVDAFLINGMIQKRRDEIRHRLMTEALARGAYAPIEPRLT
ncbi:TM2 domain-containing protein [Amaricoccus solimangrovi]|uniref:TM2 domain-containing protein n=1 Tax=Amaricoccus solimangrovi TaxID=2589815 RepID=A0A501WRP9_9RHOB|nr:TM2 domain-containing protein [Amaricoccus solimangrovi]